MLKDVLNHFKITPTMTKKSVPKGNVFGFRGVRENLGTTSFLNHCAIELASRDYSVCILDFDFSTPNDLFSTTKTVSILRRLNNMHENISTLFNKGNQGFGSITYIGSNYTNSILEFLPLRVDPAYIDSRYQNITEIIEQIKEQFDIILIDMPADLRFVEAFQSFFFCNDVFTLCCYDRPCLSKLQKDKALCSDLFDSKLISTIIHVDNLYIAEPNYKSLDSEFKLLTTISTSKALATMLVQNEYKVASKQQKIRDYEQYVYYHGVLDVVNYMLSKEDAV